MGKGWGPYLTLYCPYPNDFVIKIGSDESPFNASFTAKARITRVYQYATTFEEKGKRTQGIEPT